MVAVAESAWFASAALAADNVALEPLWTLTGLAAPDSRKEQKLINDVLLAGDTPSVPHLLPGAMTAYRVMG